MLSGPQLKLDQATYHLNNMQAKVEQLKLEEFAYELSAFIESSRNITFAMQSTYSKNPQFNAWYKTKQEEMQKDPILKFFKDKRTDVTKRGHPGYNAYSFEVVFKTNLPPGESAWITFPDGFSLDDIRIRAETVTGKEVSFTREKVKKTPIFKEFDSRHVVEVCKDYLEKLRKLVHESEDIFGNNVKK